ncbi:hypothetical protein HOP50_01g03360 [Chloropicon primus]|nr:hypothetical protein A3770_01p03470 [Chloropicon primus]UPQ97045.1 hypothetical protein HOP50_01g03360 [Chloropicon primus]|eukprot:QDZ17829.1 hypothetical protein A3770_01p03470 [Chloropicon primus]
MGKGVKFAVGDNDSSKSLDKFKPPEGFVRVKPKALDGELNLNLNSGHGDKELVVIQVPDKDVDLLRINGKVLELESASVGGLRGTLDVGAGEEYAIRQEDEVYASQFHALMPAGDKYLKVEPAKHMLVLTRALRKPAGASAPSKGVVKTEGKAKKEGKSGTKKKSKKKKRDK